MEWLDRVKAMINATVGFYFVDEASTSPTRDDFLKTHPVPPPAQQGRIHARRMWPFGFRSIIPAGVECVTVSPMGSQTQKVILGAESNSYGPTDLQTGEVAIYNSVHAQGAVCWIKLDKDGHIIVIPKAGAKVKLGSGTDAELDPIVLYTQLKAQFDSFVSRYNGHVHPVGIPAVPATPHAAATVTSSAPPIGDQASNLTTAVQSANVVAKKP